MYYYAYVIAWLWKSVFYYLLIRILRYINNLMFSAMKCSDSIGLAIYCCFCYAFANFIFLTDDTLTEGNVEAKTYQKII